ncbi:transposase (plasmid) [Bacillus cereus]|nr:transposase [Bacillus cereus]QKH10866.1 transposase [Bacillus cereus]
MHQNQINHKKVYRLMKELGLKCFVRMKNIGILLKNVA